MKPFVAIIGRPNVGKSTLFNRIAHRSKAIVIDEPGATRDRNYADAAWNEKAFILIDTGGFEPGAAEPILIQMREQTHLAIEEADAVISLLDGREGLLPADIEITKMLRSVKKPLFFAVNKIDGPRHEEGIYEFYKLGIEKIYPISAQHGIGVAELLDDLTRELPASEEGLQNADGEGRVRIAVIGRPNVGKSALVNKILGFKRTIVNPIPGTTRDAIDTPFELNGRKYLLIDTAGIRKKSRISLVLEKYSVIQALKTMDRCDIALLLIDAEEGVTEQDAKIAGLAFERGVACIVVVNKWDQVEKDNSTVGLHVMDIQDKIKFMDFAPIIFVSALTGQRVMKIFDLVEGVYAQYTQRINTSVLNEQIRAILERNPPPRAQNRPNTVSYTTQVAIKPPTFVFFVREPRAVHFSYERFLLNRLRETFGFDQVPIRIFFKKKGR